MGVVYKATDTTLDRVVALKMIQKEIMADPRIKERLKIEAKALARFNHPNIAILYEFDEVNNFFAMEFIQGETVDQIVEKTGPMPAERIRSIMKQVLPALTTAHKASIIHRDIKPANIMVTRNGTVKIMDFGIAKLPTEISGGKTISGDRVVGSYFYISPEQIQHKLIDQRTDIYALGITLYQMATGKVPFESDSDFMMMKAHCEDPPPAPSSVKADIDPVIEKVILVAIEKDPINRFQSADEMLEAILRMPEPIVRPDSLPEPEIKDSSHGLTTSQRLEIKDEKSVTEIRYPIQPKKKKTPVPVAGEARPGEAQARGFPGGRQKWLVAGAGVASVVIIIGLVLILGGKKEPAPGRSGGGNVATDADRVRLSEVPATEKGYILLKIEPSEAKLKLDDLPIEYVTDTLPYKSGRHTLKITAAGFQDTTLLFELSAGETKKLDVALVSLGEYIRLRNLPSSATAFVNGQQVVELNQPIRVKIGKNRVVIKAPGKEDWVKEVNLPAGKTIPVDYKPLTGTLILNAKPYAQFFVDGKQVGQSGVKTEVTVEAGMHFIRLVHPAGTFDTTVTVKSNFRTEVEHTFRPKR